MLRRVAWGRAALCTVGVTGSSCAVHAGAPWSSYRATTHRRFFVSRSDNEAKKSVTATAKQSTAAATNTVTAAQVFATNETVKVSGAASGNGSGSSSAEGDVNTHAQQKQQQADATPATPSASASGIRAIGIKLSEDDELVRAFNNFSKTVNGCTQAEFLVGAKQAYASLAVVISAFVERAQQPLLGLTEPSKVIAAAHEAAKMLDQEFKPETQESTEASLANLKAENGPTSPKTTLQDAVVQHVVSTITSIIPISKHLAESIFKIWMLQKEKRVNLNSIASATDYILDSKLVIFARLDKPRIYFNSDSIGAEVDVTLNNDYLRKLEPSTTTEASPKTHTGSVTAESGSNSSNHKGNKKRDDDDDFEEGMIQVLTDTTANACRTKAEEHTFVVNKQTRTLTPQVSSANANTAEETPSEAASTKPSGNSSSESKGATVSRVQVTCVKASENESSIMPANKIKGEKKEDEDVADPEACSVFIKVNGNALPPIPADARACALLTVDVVVPPERYAYNFEWFYKRIVGYENEYERIAAARVFASNSPKSLGNFLDFVMRMITGKSVEFMFSKSIGRMIGIPEDVSETPPATRKLMCMYMDASYKWVLADLITLAPVIETKLPKA